MSSDEIDEMMAELRPKLLKQQLQAGIHPDQVDTVELLRRIRTRIDAMESSRRDAGVQRAGEVCLPGARFSANEIVRAINDVLAYVDRVAGGVHSDTQILGAIRRGQIICHPLVTANIKGSSVDVTLGGDGFWVANANKSPVYDHRDIADIERFFRLEMPMLHRDFCERNGLKLLANLPDDARVIPVYPGERILAHTHEFIGILPPGTTSMQSRSTIGRNGIAVCIDAGWGDPGYATRWTMEIHNFNQELCVLAVGDRVAQIVFHSTGAVARPYGGASSKYHTTGTLEEAIRSWTPERMIPRADRDAYVPPLPLDPIPDYSTTTFEED